MSFTVYRSSAGSGKTYTLVKEYLKIALGAKEDNRYKSILAITFTNKAAAEMKARVLDALTQIAGSKKLEKTPYYLLQDLVNEMQVSEVVIREKCAVVLTSMLHNYADIAISTIDKFVHKIVRTFAYDLHIPINFSVEMDSDNLLNTAIELLISRVGSEENLTQALVAFSERKADDEKSWNIETDLKKFSQDLLKEQYSDYLNKLRKLSLADFASIRKELDTLLVDFETELQKIGEAGLQVLAENGISHKDLAGGEKAGIGKYFTYLFEKRSSNYEPTDSLEKYVADDNWVAGKASAQAKRDIQNCQDKLKELYHQAQKRVAEKYANYLVLEGVQRNIYALSVLNEIEKVIYEIKKENNQVHISEFSKKIAGIVMNEPVPFIYERIGEKYKNYLIDEFQDTSILQWQNFIPLLENSLANSDFSMLVGDGKQAIYRWRGGEVEQFSQLPKIYKSENNPLVKDREAALVRNFEEKKLSHNRRSKREIIEFNNAFFRFVVEQENFPAFLKPIYEGLEQQFDTANSGGFVNFHFLYKGEEEWDLLEATCNKVLETILQLQADNYALSDIALLTRNNKHGVALSKFLIESGIPVVSRESLLLSTSAAVNFIVNTLAYLNNSRDLIAKAGMMEFLMKSETKSGSGGINDYFEQDEFFVSYMKAHYSEWNRSKLVQLPLYELCERLVRVFNLNEGADPYVLFFLDAVHSFILNNDNSIADFLDWWERKKMNLSIVIPQGLNAVNVLTIHKSKGLEFPVVLFPYANWSSRMMSENMWVNLQEEKIPQLKSALLPLNKTLELTDFGAEYTAEIARKSLDDLNLLYVAFTRAINRLYVLCEPPQKSKILSAYYIDFLKHKEMWNEGQSDFSFGELVKKESSEAHNNAPEIVHLNHMVCSNWRQNIGLSQQSEVAWNSEQLSSEKDYGNLIHTALANIFSQEDIEKSIYSMLCEGLISNTDKAELTKKLNRLISRKEIKPFFEPGLQVKTEAEVLLVGGKTYRPDRIVFYPEKTVVLDYKTGVELEKHKSQLNNYAETLVQMGYPKVEKYLIYTESEKLLKV